MPSPVVMAPTVTFGGVKNFERTIRSVQFLLFRVRGIHLRIFYYVFTRFVSRTDRPCTPVYLVRVECEASTAEAIHQRNHHHKGMSSTTVPLLKLTFNGTVIQHFHEVRNPKGFEI